VSAGSSYPPIGDYALIGDCRAGALVSRHGSIDWCCMPRLDSGSFFARLLDWEHGGHCSIAPAAADQTPGLCNYIDDTLVVETSFDTAGGQARVIDCFTRPGATGSGHPSEILRVVEGQRGAVEVRIEVSPRFDYGAIDPWIRHHGMGAFSAIGGDDGLVIWCDAGLESDGRHDLAATATVRAGERVRLALTFANPAEIDAADLSEPRDEPELDRRLEETLEWWREWSGAVRLGGPDAAGATRSAITLKGLTYEPTGAMSAAATTSVPEGIGTGNNWDYRFSWIRDAGLAVRSLARLGFEAEADAFRRFIERSAAGNAHDLQNAFGLEGERRLIEMELEHLEGYRGSGPVRIGNAAATQLQLDCYGQLVEQSWRWYERGHEPDDDYWRFILELVEVAASRWEEPDHGFWEWRGERKHFVHSKAMCWLAVDRGLALAESCMRRAPERRWRRQRGEILEAIESDGYDRDRGVFVQAFGEGHLDAVLLRLPIIGIFEYDDERMVRTVDAIREELETEEHLLYRYTAKDRGGSTFVACTFWLAECLAFQGRLDEAREVFDAGVATSNGLGLFAEEYDPGGAEMLGNFPQGLSHFAHLEATLALAEAQVPAASATTRVEEG
jgi:GH15 family glucan-1,4-alpha-glucosidase